MSSPRRAHCNAVARNLFPGHSPEHPLRCCAGNLNNQQRTHAKTSTGATKHGRRRQTRETATG
jgi:hypothetical protein